MKKILIAVFVLVSVFSYGQIVDIPDPNFKKALVSTNYVDINKDCTGDADFNNDGEIQRHNFFLNFCHINLILRLYSQIQIYSNI
jgi:hypothetical protein